MAQANLTPLHQTYQKGQVYFGRFYLGKCHNANGKTELLRLADEADASETPQVERTPASARRLRHGAVK